MGYDIKDAIKGTIASEGKQTSNVDNRGYMVIDTNPANDGANVGDIKGYVDKETLAEIVRQELGKILNGGTAQTTGITKVPSLVGNALGATTVANLASVLGEADTTQISGEAVNLDNLKQNGKYRLASCTLTGTGMQSSELNKNNCDVVVFKNSFGDVIQLISFYDTEVCYQRLFWHNTGEWFVTRMDSIPSFYKDYNSFSTLSRSIGATNGILVRNYDAPAYGETITTDLMASGLLVVNITGSQSTSIYGLNTTASIVPISENGNIKTIDGDIYTIGVDNNGFLTFRYNNQSAYNFRLHIIQICGINL